MEFLQQNQQDLTACFQHENYKLLTKIGEGGFAQVFKAIQLSTQQTVAVKVLTLNPGLQKEQVDRQTARFEREAQLSAALDHPHIVRLLDKGQYGNRQLFAVFEFIDGMTLKETLLREGVLEPIAAADIMAQVLDALAHAHSKGVIHRDIKPANIILSNMGVKTHVKILDYGIGTYIESQRLDHLSLTLTQETLGTPSYSSPEQLRGETPSPKTDLYLWGLVLIECLTGEQAIKGSSVASIIHKQLSPTNIPIPAFLAGHPCANLLRRVLQKNPVDRVATAEEVYTDLRTINFSSIIRHRAARHSSASNSSTQAESDVTVINQGDLLYTGFTERKQITILCIIFSMRTEHDNIHDMEIVDTLLRDYKNQCIDIAQRYGGFHVGTLGNVALFYFGYPASSDNDTRLCARSALDIISSVNKRHNLPTNQYIDTQVGIHTGPVTTYVDTTPDGVSVDRAVSLAQIAPLNRILCSQALKDALNAHIEFEPLEHFAKVAQRETNYLLTKERQVEAFGFLRAKQCSYELVGRHKELNKLLKALDSSENYSYLHVFGEAGIGKSRLIVALRSHTQTYQHLIAQCLPEYEHSGLYPILTMIRSHYALDSLSHQAAIAVLRNTLKRTLAQESISHALPVLCSWFGFESPPSISSSVEDTEDQKSTLFMALKALLNTPGISASKKLIIIEDLHWADKLSIEFLADFTASKPNLSRLVSTSRQPLPQTLFQNQGETLEVNKFSQQETSEFIALLLKETLIAPRLSNMIAQRTDGVPLFIEELVNMLVNKRLVHRINGVMDLMSQKNLDQIPTNLYDSLQQKLDSLRYSKETAQLASTIGREFNYSILTYTSPQTEEKLQLDLDELLDNDLVFLQRKVDGDNYIFKHALVRDAAYGSMLKSQREHCHLLIAEHLETRQEKQKTDPGLLAMHWANAKKYDKACARGIDFANLALKRSSAHEAISQCENILQWLEHLDIEQKTEQKVSVYRLLTAAYMEAKGWASEEVRHYTEATLTILKTQKRSDDIVPQLWWQMLGGVVGGKRTGLAQISAEMDVLFDSVKAINKSAIRCAQGFYQFAEGNRATCIKYLHESINHYDNNEDLSHQQIFGFDAGVFAKATLGRSLVDVCEQEKAINYATEAVKEAKVFNNIPSIGIALMYYAIVFQQYGKKDEAHESSRELITLAEKHDMPIYQHYGQMLYDWSIGSTEKAEAILTALTQLDSFFAVGQFQSFYADTLMELGDDNKALGKINQCLSLNSTIDEHYYTPHLLLKKVQCMRRLNDFSDEDVHLTKNKAIELAKKQGVIRIMDS